MSRSLLDGRREIVDFGVDLAEPAGHFGDAIRLRGVERRRLGGIKGEVEEFEAGEIRGRQEFPGTVAQGEFPRVAEGCGIFPVERLFAHQPLALEQWRNAGPVEAEILRDGDAGQLGKGGQEGELMQLAGWKSRSMVERYAGQTAAERAQRSYDRYDPGEDL